MKSVIIFFLLITSFYTELLGQSDELITLRDLSAGSTQESAVQITRLLDSLPPPTPLDHGYWSIALFIHAKSSYSPFDKIKYFKSGKKMLDAAINSDVSCVELRYLRFCVQTNVPFFLNYSGNIEEDKRIILQNWSKITDTDLKKRIRSYMMRSEYCNETEKKGFRNG